MKRVLPLVLFVAALCMPAKSFAKTHKDMFDVPCTTLWPAVKDTLRNSGKYGIVGISNEEMTASYIMGGNLAAKRINSLVLNPSGSGCVLQVQTAFSGFVHNDAGDMRKRVEASLAKLQGTAKAETKPAK